MSVIAYSNPEITITEISANPHLTKSPASQSFMWVTDQALACISFCPGLTVDTSLLTGNAVIFAPSHTEYVL